MADPQIKVIPTPYDEVLALLHSDALRKVEQAIAASVGCRIVEDYSNVCTNYTRGDMSVSGLTVAEIEALLVARSEEIIAFGIRFLRDEEATKKSIQRVKSKTRPKRWRTTVWVRDSGSSTQSITTSWQTAPRRSFART